MADWARAELRRFGFGEDAIGEILDEYAEGLNGVTPATEYQASAELMLAECSYIAARKAADA